MRPSCNEGVANHVGPESCGGDREIIPEALTGKHAGRVLSLENFLLRSADAVLAGGRRQRISRHRKEYPPTIQVIINWEPRAIPLESRCDSGRCLE